MTTKPPDEKPKIFVVFGMPRCGTTYLYHTLQGHPAVFVPYRKESYYFSVNHDKGLDWFRSLYEGQTPDRIGADINPMYFHDPHAASRIKEYDPETRVILGVREPVDFAISIYGNMLAHGLQVPPITEVVGGYDWALTPENNLRFALPPGFLQQAIDGLRSTFGRNLMVYDFACFDRSPTAVLQSLETFLGLSHFFDAGNTTTAKINASGRRDLLLLNRLVANQRILDLVYGLVPKSGVRMLRRWYERLSVRDDAKAAAKAPTNQVSDEERRALELRFAGDVEFYNRLFATCPVFDGTGQPIPASTSTET